MQYIRWKSVREGFTYYTVRFSNPGTEWEELAEIELQGIYGREIAVWENAHGNEWLRERQGRADDGIEEFKDPSTEDPHNEKKRKSEHHSSKSSKKAKTPEMEGGLAIPERPQHKKKIRVDTNPNCDDSMNDWDQQIREESIAFYLKEPTNRPADDEFDQVANANFKNAAHVLEKISNKLKAVRNRSVHSLVQAALKMHNLPYEPGINRIRDNQERGVHLILDATKVMLSMSGSVLEHVITADLPSFRQSLDENELEDDLRVLMKLGMEDVKPFDLH